MENSAIEIISRNVKMMTEGAGFTDFFLFLTQLTILILLGFITYYLIHIGNQHVAAKNKVNVGKKQIYQFVLVFIVLLVVIFMFRIRGLLFEILAPFIFALVFAYILNPIVHYLQTKGIERLWGVLLVYLTIFFALFLLSVTLIPRISEEVRSFIEFMPKYSNNTYDYLYELYVKYNRNVESLPEELEGVKNLLRLNIDRIQGLVFDIFTSVTNTLLNMFSKVIGLVLIPILTFYFLKDADGFKKSIVLFIPKCCRHEVLNIARDIDEVLGGFIRGQLTVAAFVGILTTVALLILRVEFAVLVGLIAGTANVIPYFGPVIGIVPGVLFALMDGPVKALWVIVTFTIIQQIESAIIAPKIVGKSVGIHPIFVILALIVGGRFLGILGLLIAVPTAAIMKVLGRHLMNYIVKF
ncbi:AI-2E family transporter [Clostridium formicaceticum]|uniref:AI-2 transport protein TqsA n=1 Tax=Clostridium formicaceticum TaxID=1497 RepID=A0AAC9RKT2_9CLOT|nr:AI-2E family transporter [Clostridium formicaceticum]AOY76998.1 AI-2E family transporter [Clostridium formicaceticum]ARE87487.1 AI-2 transport protein TqsA [Clostridium formicaceticum]